MDFPTGKHIRCAKCERQLNGPKGPPPLNSFSIVRCASCNTLLAVIYGHCLVLDEETLSTSDTEVKAQYLYQVLMEHFGTLTEDLAQEVSETWDEAIKSTMPEKKKDNALEKLQQNIEEMDIDSFNNYLESLDPPDL